MTVNFHYQPPRTVRCRSWIRFRNPWICGQVHGHIVQKKYIEVEDLIYIYIYTSLADIQQSCNIVTLRPFKRFRQVRGKDVRIIMIVMAGD